MHRPLHCSLATLLLLVALSLSTHAEEKAEPLPSAVFDVRAHGATGDGKTLDTMAINAAIAACSKAGGGQVLFPPGRYLSGTVRLQSGITLYLEAGARLIGTPDLDQYQQPTPPDFMPEAKWGKWHRALLLGENVEDVTIAGAGIIDGNKVFDPTGEEKRRGPHTLVFVNCRRFTIRDVSFVDSANYAIFFQISDDVEVRNVKFIGGWDGVHFRGAPERACRNVQIVGCQFFTGDDAIAGRYWDETLITDCIVNSSCNGIRLIGPARRLIVRNCFFYGPGVRPHITSNRTNMLSGIILQPGAWDATTGALDEVLLTGNTMHNVASPVTLWAKQGNTVGRVTIADLRATSVYRAAISVESWADEPIDHVTLRGLDVEFAGGGEAKLVKEPVKGPGVDARVLPAWGVYARNVSLLTMEDVRLRLTKGDDRPVVFADRVERLTLEAVYAPRIEGVAEPIVTTGESRVETREPMLLSAPTEAGD